MAETAENIAERLALLAGVPVDEVTVDRERRRALVTARPLEGATLLAYAELERRIDATEPEWDIRLTPPLRALPTTAFERADGDDEGGIQYRPTAAGRQSLALIAWAQNRVGVPVRLSGPADAVAAARALLVDRGVEVTTETTGPGWGDVAARWSTGEN